MNEKEQKEIFSGNLSDLIEKSGKEQKQIAFDLDEKPSTFNQWVTGKAIPSVSKVHVLADYFNVSFDSLVNPPSEQDFSISDEEKLFVMEWRNIDDQSKEMIKRILAYGQKLRGEKDDD